MSQPTVSVVIATHNRPEFVVDAIESAFAQTADILEVIVVDDVSTTDLRPVLSRFSDRLRLERLSKNSGANVARNRGVDLARGTLVGFLDDDDVWVPDKIERQIAALEDGHIACLCATRAIDGSSREKHGRRLVDEDWLRASTPCGTSGLLVKRDAIVSERFDPAIPRGQDWDLFVRLVQIGPIAYVASPLYLRRSGHDRITTAALRRTPAELLSSASALHKHRQWLGERAYRRRLARVLLSYIGQRPNKISYVAAAVWHAGIGATASELARKVRR